MNEAMTLVGLASSRTVSLSASIGERAGVRCRDYSAFSPSGFIRVHPWLNNLVLDWDREENAP